MKLQEYILSATRAALAYRSGEEMKDIWNNSTQEIFRNVQDPPRFYSANGCQAHSWIQSGIFHLAIRGTEELNDVFADLNVRRTTLFDDDSSILVHTGFLNYFNSIKDHIEADIKASLNHFHTIQVTGHSLGGAIATIASAYFGKMINMPESQKDEGQTNFKTKDKTKKRIVCYTIGSPRVGNTNFVNWFHTHVDESMRIANDDDPITLFPISCLYTHVSEALCVTDKCVKEIHSDTKWYWRLFSFPFYKASVKDHSCNMYINRLLSQKKQRQ
jgi:predicted lipase